MFSDGGTNIYQALRTGIDQVSLSNAPYHHIILLTDGRSDPADYRPLLTLAQQRKITISTVGVPAKMRQLAQVKSWDIPRDDHRAVVVGETGKVALEACALEGSADASAALGDLNSAITYLMKGRDLWTPTVGDPFGDMDRPAARLEMARGRLDTAEHFAVASLRRWDGGRLISRTNSALVLATVYVTAGDSRGLPLAHQTITDVSKFGSVRIRRKWVLPLAEALDTRSGSDARDLARMARQVATTRA